MKLTKEIMAKLASNQLGLREVRAAGYILEDAMAAGYSLEDAMAAGYSLREALAAGYSLREVLAAGYSLREVLAAGYSLGEVQELDDSIPAIHQPYTQMWQRINDGAIKHSQSTFGPDADPATNLCKTAMCTAGHLVNMGGKKGYALKDKFNFKTAAALIHYKAHPGWPCQDFGNIKQEFALAYIEIMAGHEAAGTSPLDDV